MAGEFTNPVGTIVAGFACIVAGSTVTCVGFRVDAGVSTLGEFSLTG